MGADCDGGGNRYLSTIDLTKKPELADFFENRASVPSGVCSLQLRPHETPWIVCPRRLFFLAKSGTPNKAEHRFQEQVLLKHSGYPPGTKLGVWSELRIGYSDQGKRFQYTFDYILMPVARRDQVQIEQSLDMPWTQIRRYLRSSGYSIILHSGVEYVEDFPTETPTIVEIMTSSTSGGDQKRRTTIPLAFRMQF